MAKPAPGPDDGDADMEVGRASSWVAGVPGVLVALKRSQEQMGLGRSALTLTALNQHGGFDCPGCAWPDPEHRSAAEFCENGAKAVAEEATQRLVGAEFFATHSVASLHERSDHWLGQQGRIQGPMVLREGATHYEPIPWDDAFGLVAEHLQGLDSPDQAAFYTSGRTSNEAAFCWQLLARQLGTNNLPDCSNMCHESSGEALQETIGIGKGTVTLEDVEAADLILIAGQNPGTNHPRMLSSLERVKEQGGHIVAVNPLVEAGLRRFKNPQKVSGVLGAGTDLADDYCQIRVNGDLAFFAGLGKLLVEADRRDGGVLDHAFIAEHTLGYDALVEHYDSLGWGDILRGCGIPKAQLEQVARRIVGSERMVICWAMGLTQHKNSVWTIREIMNVLLLTGSIGRRGAGACPVRGHSNVQGDRTMGIFEKPEQWFLDALQAEFGIPMPQEWGHDTVDTIRALRDGTVRVFLAMGGNFVRATPDTAVTEKALRRADLTVHVSTKLNGSHTVTGRQALILPTLGRTERDTTGGREQFVTVEDSMSMVHASWGRITPTSRHLRSEVDIVCTLASATFPQSPVDWAAMRRDYSIIRRHIERVVPGFADVERRARLDGGFLLPNPPRDSRQFPTSRGKALLTVNELTAVEVPDGRLLLQTVRSHDQFNTTIYGMDDRYRGIRHGRRVVFVNPLDRAALGLEEAQVVDIVSEWPVDDGRGGRGVEERRAEAFRLVDYPETARGCAATYFPEANVLVPLDSTADVSNTPTSKSVVVRLEPTSHVGPAPVR
ncbi:FdhF/YdeP family oxidoreductase [Ornithinimicrobium sediminis]|uniref:FdhF/YdeP family oxidoreductase n=1 Tax=Ornithinimicrobium sediminis TaxID=2904603 RepID=UPI0038CD33F0